MLTYFYRIFNDPYTLGKPLGYKWFRELKNVKYRIYYLVYDKEVVVLFVGVSDKKSQQVVINFVKNNLDLFRNLVG